MRFAQDRWKGCTIGPSVLACAPDGTPEAYFFIVLKPGAQELRLAELSFRIAGLQKQRVELENRKAGASAGEGADLHSRIKALWRQMRGDDTCATVVVGANEGREPFIASFGGLPPQLVLREDAMEFRRRQLGGQDPGEPKVVWLPPLFVFFEFDARAGHPSVLFQAQGTDLIEKQPPAWERPVVPDDILTDRKAKWKPYKENRNE